MWDAEMAISVNLFPWPQGYNQVLKTGPEKYRENMVVPG